MLKTYISSEGHCIIKESSQAFDLYILNKKKSVLLITAHGNTQAAVSTTTCPKIQFSPEAYQEFVPPGMISRELDFHRASARFPSEYNFTPSVAISYFCEHNKILISERDSTVRRILQARITAYETYMPGRRQSDYNLEDVSQSQHFFSGIRMLRKDFIKAILLEAEFLREPTASSRALIEIHKDNPNAVIASVPDILMVTDSVRLSEVLNHPLVKTYSRIFCAFCRSVVNGTMASINQHAPGNRGIVSQSTQHIIEQRVLKNMTEMRVNFYSG